MIEHVILSYNAKLCVFTPIRLGVTKFFLERVTKCEQNCNALCTVPSISLLRSARQEQQNPQDDAAAQRRKGNQRNLNERVYEIEYKSLTIRDKS